MFAVYFALCFAYPAGMGFGDVKLPACSGCYTAWLGLGGLGRSGLFLGFLLGGRLRLALIACARGGRKTAVPVRAVHAARRARRRPRRPELAGRTSRARASEPRPSARRTTQPCRRSRRCADPADAC
jgi:hypothetical protein